MNASDLVPLLVASLATAVVFRWLRRPRPDAQDWLMVAAVVLFLPVPFIVPFFALSLVPASYLAASCFFGSYSPLAMAIPAGVYSAVLAAVSVPVSKRLARMRRGRVAFAVALAAASLLPIYVFDLELGEFGNIFGLFSEDGPHWGQ
jgi:hypothetical protein